MNEKVSIIIPVYNDTEILLETLSRLQYARKDGHEIIVVDGGSRDFPGERIAELTDKFVQSRKGRSIQMNSGAEYATGDLFVFLHADTWLPGIHEFIPVIRAHTEKAHDAWGFFRVRLSGTGILFRLIETGMNLRSRFTHIATGDQAIIVTRELFERVSGYEEIPLMEDIALCKKLGVITKPLCLDATVQSSSRRWEQQGVIKTILQMWCYRIAYFMGMKPEQLVKHYYG